MATRGRLHPAILDGAWALLCTGVAVALLLWSGGIWDIVTSGDLHNIYVPKYEYSARALLGERRVPLWNPYEFCGIPLLATAHGAMLYPPVPILFAALPARAALQAFYALHVLLLLWATTAYLRHHDIARPAAAVAGLLALAVVLRCPDLVGVDHPNFLASVAWIPVQLLCWEHALRRTVLPWVVLLGLAAAAQWLTGYPDFPMDGAVLLSLVAIFGGEGSAVRRLAILLGGLALGGALAAVQIAPLSEAVRESTRGALEWQFPMWRARLSIHSASDLGQTLLQRYGLAGLALGALGACRPTRAHFAWSAALVWSVFALNLPFSLLYGLPPYSGVRFPLGWSGSSGVFLGFLAAAGVMRLWRRQHWARAAAVAMGLATAAQSLATVAQAPSAAAFTPMTRHFPAPDYDLIANRAPQLRALLAGDSEGRLLAEREAVSGAGLREGLLLPNGHEPAVPPRRILHLLEEAGILELSGTYRSSDWAGVAARPDLAALLGVGTVVVPREEANAVLSAGFAQIGTLPPNDLVVHRPPVPRVRLVHRTVDAPDEATTLARVIECAPDAAHVAVVETGALNAPLAEAPSNAHEEARVALYEPERVVIEATVASRALLVLTDTFYPGWEATVDSTPAPILRADHAFRGVVLENGRHRVVFRYAPRSFRLGAVISAAAALVALVLLGTGTAVLARNPDVRPAGAVVCVSAVNWRGDSAPLASRTAARPRG